MLLNKELVKGIELDISEFVAGRENVVKTFDVGGKVIKIETNFCGDYKRDGDFSGIIITLKEKDTGNVLQYFKNKFYNLVHLDVIVAELRTLGIILHTKAPNQFDVRTAMHCSQGGSDDRMAVLEYKGAEFKFQYGNDWKGEDDYSRICIRRNIVDVQTEESFVIKTKEDFMALETYLLDKYDVELVYNFK